MSRELHDRKNESRHLGNLGGYYIDYGGLEKSNNYCIQSIDIADQINYAQVQSGSRSRLALIYLLQTDLVDARTIIESAITFDVPENNHNVATLQGIIFLRQGNVNLAIQAFTSAIIRADEILAKTPEYYSALDARGLALCGLAICDDKKYVADANDAFHNARKIASYAGVVKQSLRLFDELVKCDEEGILKDVRNAVEGKE